MTITRTALGTIADTSNTNAYSSSSVAGAANQLIVAIVVMTDQAGTPPVSPAVANNPYGISNANWTKQEDLLNNDDGLKRITVFTGTTGGSSPGADTFDVTVSDNATGCIMYVVGYTDSSGAVPTVVQTANDTEGATSSPVLNTLAALGPASWVLAAFQINRNPPGGTADSGWQEQADIGGGTTPVFGLWVIDSNGTTSDNTPSGTWSAGQHTAVAVEIGTPTAPASTSTDPNILWPTPDQDPAGELADHSGRSVDINDRFPTPEWDPARELADGPPPLKGVPTSLISGTGYAGDFGGIDEGMSFGVANDTDRMIQTATGTSAFRVGFSLDPGIITGVVVNQRTGGTGTSGDSTYRTRLFNGTTQIATGKDGTDFSISGGIVEQQNTAEGGTNTTTVTVGNSGGASGDVWESVRVDNALTFDNTHPAHDALSYKMVNGIAAQQEYLEWTLSGADPHYGRLYMYWTGWVDANFSLIYYNGGGTTVSFGLNAAHQLIIRDTGLGTPVATGSVVLSLSTTYRLEWFIQYGATGSATLKVFVGDSTTPLDSITVASGNFNTVTPTFVRYGLNNQVSGTATVWLDDIEDNQIQYPGPSVVAEVGLGNRMDRFDGLSLNASNLRVEVEHTSTGDVLGFTSMLWVDVTYQDTFRYPMPEWDPAQEVYSFVSALVSQVVSWISG